MYAIGYDIGSSSVKAALVHSDTGEVAGLAQHPQTEMAISAPQPGWAEQDPAMWWSSLCAATAELLRTTGISPAGITSVGLGYQMHGLVLIDDQNHVLRPAIIWCDSRAVRIGDDAFDSIGRKYCYRHLLNAPGNFTASRLAWVRHHEPGIFDQVHYMLLPGDYIAMKLTGEINTTVPALSEAILWDFQEHQVARRVLEHFRIEPQMVPPLVGTFDLQGRLSLQAAEATGLKAGIPLTYRAGDQPNNALALGVTDPGEVAATAGTSGVIYGLVDRLTHDDQSRVNSFAHVNHRAEDPRIGLLLCINGAGIEYAWMRQHLTPPGTTYQQMEAMMSAIPVGSDGLTILPFGNGAERMLMNASPGASFHHLEFNRHTRAHLLRAGLEGIAFAFAYGFSVLRELGLDPDVIRVGNDNLFQSQIFGDTVSHLLQCRVQVHAMTGAIGAAQASGLQGMSDGIAARISGGHIEHVYEPQHDPTHYQDAYEQWCSQLARY